MSKSKKQVRARFREAVWTRDAHACRMCGDTDSPLDAHHITDRNEMPQGGYVAANGISLCPPCHIKAEIYHTSAHTSCPEGWHPDDLYRVIGSSLREAIDASHRL